MLDIYKRPAGYSTTSYVQYAYGGRYSIIMHLRNERSVMASKGPFFNTGTKLRLCLLVKNPPSVCYLPGGIHNDGEKKGLPRSAFCTHFAIPNLRFRPPLIFSSFHTSHLYPITRRHIDSLYPNFRVSSK